MVNGKFSDRLQSWLNDKNLKTLNTLTEAFSEKSFAVLFLLLMAIPALPLPTGGLTHIFEIIVMLLALELIAGRKSIWLPHRWLNHSIPSKLQVSALPSLITLIRKVEKYTKPRLANTLSNSTFIRLVGLIVFIFTLFAFLAPPFSGLDTLPAFGVVLLSLALIFEDVLLSIAGLTAGLLGIGLVVTIGRLVFQFF